MEELYTVYGPKTTLEMSWREAEQILKKSDIAIVIVGATEQHGPHNPMGVDTFIPLETAKRALRLLEKEEIKALIPTPVPFGMSHHHLHYPGTIALRPETLIELLFDIGQCLADQGINKIVFMIGHTSAEQESCCHIAGLRLQQKFGTAYTLFNRVRVRQRFTEEEKAKFNNARRSKIFDSHAGEREKPHAFLQSLLNWSSENGLKVARARLQIESTGKGYCSVKLLEKEHTRSRRATC